MKQYEAQSLIDQNSLWQLAAKIFVKKLPNEHVTERTEQNIRSVAQQSIRAAEIFFEEVNGNKPVEDTTYERP